jgi:hypothetical protein
VRVNLDRGTVSKSGLVQTERLAASASANLQASQSRNRRRAVNGAGELALILLEPGFEGNRFTRDDTGSTSLCTVA